MHPAKRRRLDQSTATLTKPFRSPLRVDPEKQSPASLTSDNPTSKSASTAITKSSSSSPSKRWAKNADYPALSKQYSVLSQKLNSLRQSLDTAQQALKIETSGKNAELDDLIIKWRTAARESAQELFPAARDQVNSIGGVKALQKREQESQKDRLSNDMPPDFELTEEQRQQRKLAFEEDQADAIKYGLNQSDQADENEECLENESFTMDIMLEQMHIPLDTIGFDKRLQRWVD